MGASDQMINSSDQMINSSDQMFKWSSDIWKVQTVGKIYISRLIVDMIESLIYLGSYNINATNMKAQDGFRVEIKIWRTTSEDLI